MSEFSSAGGQASSLAKSSGAVDELDLYFSAFVRLDKLVNQFFATYSNVSHTSFKMSLLWEGVMHCRTHLVNAIIHMKDQHQYLDSAFIPDRILEVREYVHNIRAVVSRALSLLVVYISTVCSDSADWTRERDLFNTRLALTIRNQLFELCEKWRLWLGDLYGIGTKVKAAYERHIEEQEILNRRRLFNRELDLAPEVLERLQRQFRQWVAKAGNDETEEFKPHMLLFKVEDVIKFFRPPAGGNEPLSPTEVKAAAKLQRTMEGLLKLKDEVITALERRGTLPERDLDSLEELKSFEFGAIFQGLWDIGPFGIARLEQARSKFRVLTNVVQGSVEGETEKVERYLELDDDKELKQFESVFGTERVTLKCKITELTKVTLTSAKQRKLLGIPKLAKYYAWVFPCVNASKVAQVESEPSLLMSLGLTKVDEMLEYSYKATTDPIKAILITGGYAYFDKKKQLLAVNGLTPYGDVLFFAGPFAFPSGSFERGRSNQNGRESGEEEEKEDADTLKLDDMQEVTIPDMLKEPICCAKFGWLAEAPSLGINDGSFYYTYTKESGHDPNFFVLMRSEDVQVVRPRYNDTPSLQHLDYLKELKKASWQRSRLEFMELERKRGKKTGPADEEGDRTIVGES